jgi:hypothetical protein
MRDMGSEELWLTMSMRCVPLEMMMGAYNADLDSCHAVYEQCVGAYSGGIASGQPL